MPYARRLASERCRGEVSALLYHLTAVSRSQGIFFFINFLLIYLLGSCSRTVICGEGLSTLCQFASDRNVVTLTIPVTISHI